MKMGIMTFVHTSNYGAALQAFALQRVLIKKGVFCEIIDYEAEFLEEFSPRQVFKRRGIANKIAAPAMYCVYSKRLKVFEAFAEKHCRMSPKAYDSASIAEIGQDYDRIIVGSDQVWNMDILKGDESFFLGFVAGSLKKYSYAASMGSRYLSEKRKEYFEKRISEFSLISVREQTSQRILQERRGKEVRCDIDPTLLLEKEAWHSFISGCPCSRQYILVYMIPENKHVYDRIRAMAKRENCRILWVRNGIRKIPKFHNLNTISPEEFLNYIYYAKFIVAGSFHAVCFSLIYQKEFFYTEAGVPERSVRLLDLIEKVGIKGRNLDDYGNHPVPINYEIINKKVAALREQSMKTIADICDAQLQG